MYKGRCMRTLVVVNTKTHCIVATREEDMNGGSNAKITKPLYKLLTDGNHIGYYAHRPDDIRVPTEINGRYFVKPMGWVPKVKAVPVSPVVPPAPKVRKFYNATGYGDGTDFVEYDGNTFTCVSNKGTRTPNIAWRIDQVMSWVGNGKIIEA